MQLPKYQRRAPKTKTLHGVDLFVHWNGTNADELAEKVRVLGDGNVGLSMITNRGIKVWPEGFSETFCTDHWRCRFKPLDGKPIEKIKIIQLLQQAHVLEIDVIKTENLYHFDGEPAFSLGQGQ
jgi:isocitrate dehydrogenase